MGEMASSTLANYRNDAKSDPRPPPSANSLNRVMQYYDARACAHVMHIKNCTRGGLHQCTTTRLSMPPAPMPP